MANVAEGLKYAFYILRHPIDGFYDMRHESRGNLGSVLIIAGCLAATKVIRSQYSGFLGTAVDLSRYNLLRDVLDVVIPLLLWCVANWSVTALADGEGRFVDICMAAGYSLTPLVFANLAATVLSNVLALDERGFIGLVDGAAYVLTGLLLFLGTLTIHQYTVRKTILIVLLTLFGGAFIVFLVVLFAGVLDNMLNYVLNMYTEVKMRM